MLESVVGLSALVVAVATLMLPIAGLRPWGGWRWRVVAFLLVPTLGIVGVAASGDALPGVLVGLLVAVLALVLPKAWYLLGSVFFSSLVVAFALYGVYLTWVTIVLGSDVASVALGSILLLFEIGAMALITASAFELVDALCATPEASARPPEPASWPVVCLQVPTYNEPPDLVIETLRSLVGLDYPALRLQVIDNNTADESLWRPVEGECERLREAGHRIAFLHLPSWPGYKAGALNRGLTEVDDDVEIIGVVDADYVVEPGWLRATVPHFDDLSVAFVQTPQDYRQWEGSAFYRACYVGFALFFRISMVSRARRNAIIFAGTMGLVRRSALEAIGGWDEAIITEDAEASLRLLDRGHRAVYLPTSFGRGIMPLTYEGLRKQRFRWAFGGIQILRRHRGSLMPWNRRSRLTQRQRYDYLLGSLWWFNDALTLGFTLFVFAAAAAVIAGRPFAVQRLSALGLVLPFVFVGVSLLRYLWALNVTTRAGPALALAALRVNLSLSWVIALACFRGLTEERGVFLRTPKFRGTPAVRELRMVTVETILAATALVLLVGVVVRTGLSTVGVVLAVLIGWSLLIYGSATGYALGDPTRAPVTASLASKAILEVAPRVGGVVRSRPARAALASLLLAVVVLSVGVAIESDRAPVAELPFQDLPEGPLFRGGTSSESSSTPIPSPTRSPSPTTSPSGSPTSAPPGVSTPFPSRSPGRTPASTTRPTTPPLPAPSATPTSRPGRTPAASVPAPTPRPRATPPPPPHPTVTPPPHPTP